MAFKSGQMTKREFLKILGLSGTSLFASELLIDALLASEQNRNFAAAPIVAAPNIYHTSTRRRRACRACKSHAVGKIYSSREAANKNRPHPGCNCRIVEEQISWQNYARAFYSGSPSGETEYDKRWGWPPPSPSGFDPDYPTILKEYLKRG